MKKLLWLALTLCFATLLYAQDRPVFLPEDVESRSLTLNKFSRPGVLNKSRGRGVEISFGQVGGSDLVAEDDTIAINSKIGNIQQLNFKLKVPIANKESFRMLFGYSYRPEKYNFETIGQNHADVFKHIDGRWLKNNEFSLFANKSFNEKHYLTVRGKLAYNGDYDKFIVIDSKYQVFTGTAMFGIKKSEDTEWGFGLNLSNSFRSTSLIPFVLYNHNFSEKFGIEVVLPVLVYARWNVDKKTLLLAGAEYSSRSYAIDVEEFDLPQTYSMNHSEIRFPVRLEKLIYSWFWIGAQAGLQYNFSTDFESKNNDFKVEPKASPYFKIGIFVSPPDDFDN